MRWSAACWPALQHPCLRSLAVAHSAAAAAAAAVAAVVAVAAAAVDVSAMPRLLLVTCMLVMHVPGVLNPKNEAG